MMSPDLIKEALSNCSEVAQCSQCVYRGHDCIEYMCADALEYIEQLESRNIKPLVSSIRLRLWRLFHPLKWRKQKKILANLDEMHEYTGIKVVPLNRR